VCPRPCEGVATAATDSATRGGSSGNPGGAVGCRPGRPAPVPRAGPAACGFTRYRTLPAAGAAAS
jgi:hypothetical protein